MFSRGKPPHLRTGTRGEHAAALYLLLKFYRILERNYLCSVGEIDIIARKKGVIVFVEVRTRHAVSLVDPIESITDLKLAHFMDAARYYLSARCKEISRCRFDFISVRTGGPLRGRIRHYIDAFHITDERPVAGVKLKSRLRHRPRPGGR